MAEALGDGSRHRQVGKDAVSREHSIAQVAPAMADIQASRPRAR